MGTLDSCAAIYGPMIRFVPSLAMYFFSFIMIVSIALMNLVTAVIVEGAIEQAKQIKEAIPKISEVFHLLDADGSGDVSLEEVANADDNVKGILLEVLKADDLVDLFEMLDVDGSGSLDIDEFCDGVVKMVQSDQPVETLTILKHLKLNRRDSRIVNERLERIEKHLGCYVPPAEPDEKKSEENLSDG